MSAKKNDDPGFEKALEELETITARLEAGRDSLEESMSLYERAMELETYCRKKLEEAEGKWKVLRKKRGKVVAEELKSSSIPEPGELSGSPDEMF